MARVNYDVVAPQFDRRYQEHDYRGVTDALLSFVAGAEAPRPLVLDAGCGTGHWLRLLAEATSCRAIGLDLSAGMLAVARESLTTARVVRATADALPIAPHSLDGIVCINAVHHFPAPQAFVTEAKRVLRPGGRLLVIGLDPHAGIDTWWLYDAFPQAFAADRRRYPSGRLLRSWMTAAGFEEVRSDVVQQWTGSMTGSELLRRGLLERSVTSQLMVIGDDAYEVGVRLVTADPDALRKTDLHLFATSGVAGSGEG